jgi:hypothetical protein
MLIKLRTVACKKNKKTKKTKKHKKQKREGRGKGEEETYVAWLEKINSSNSVTTSPKWIGESEEATEIVFMMDSMYSKSSVSCLSFFKQERNV